MKLNRKGKRYVLDLTEIEFHALRSLVNQANGDGDHTAYLKNVAMSSEIRATNEITDRLRLQIFDSNRVEI